MLYITLLFTNNNWIYNTNYHSRTKRCRDKKNIFSSFSLFFVMNYFLFWTIGWIIPENEGKKTEYLSKEDFHSKKYKKNTNRCSSLNDTRTIKTPIKRITQLLNLGNMNNTNYIPVILVEILPIISSNCLIVKNKKSRKTNNSNECKIPLNQYHNNITPSQYFQRISSHIFPVIIPNINNISLIENKQNPHQKSIKQIITRQKVH